MVSDSKRDTLDRQRARHAYANLANPKNRAKICKRVQGLPIEVRSQGLSVAVATLLKEDRSESHELARLMAMWVLSDASIVGDTDNPRDPSGYQLLDRTMTCRRSEYLALQAEALAYLEHHKRLASALEADGS